MPNSRYFMVIWLNGPFGGGKTSVANELVRLLPNTRIFDTEQIGYMLAANFKDYNFADFQDIPLWRSLVPIILDHVGRFVDQNVVVPQSVLRQSYWNEISSGLRQYSQSVFHAVIHADSKALSTRIVADTLEPEAYQWRLNHISAYESASIWMKTAADLTLDSTNVPITEVTNLLATSVMPLLSVDIPYSDI